MKAKAGILTIAVVGMIMFSGCGGGGLDDSATNACGLAEAGWEKTPWRDLVDAAKQSNNTAFRDLALEMEIQVNDASESPEDDLSYVGPNYMDRFLSLCRDSGYE